MSRMLISNIDTSKTFGAGLRTATGNYTNSGYDDDVLAEGTVMGRISATGLLTPLTSGASDGSQFPVGILLTDYTVEGGDTIELTIAVAGDVDENKIVLQGSDTLDTVISGRRIRDRIGSDTVGIKLVGGTQLTGFDNQ